MRTISIYVSRLVIEGKKYYYVPDLNEIFAVDEFINNPSLQISECCGEKLNNAKKFASFNKPLVVVIKNTKEYLRLNGISIDSYIDNVKVSI